MPTLFRDDHRTPKRSSPRLGRARAHRPHPRPLSLGDLCDMSSAPLRGGVLRWVPDRIPLSLHAPGKAAERAAPKPLTALSRTPATQRSEVEGYPGSSATTCREAAPNLAFRKGLLQGNQIHPCQLLAPPSPRSAKPSGGEG